MNRSIKNMLVGIFVVSAIAIFVSVVMFLKPSVGDGKQTLKVRFSNINSLSIGTRVLFAGRPVGQVVSIEEIQDARTQPTDEIGRVYFYQLILEIDSKVKVYNTDEVSIETSGLLGEKSIAITPKAPPQGVSPKQLGSQPIYADSVDMFQSTLLDFSELAASMEQTFNQVSQWMEKHGEDLALAIREAGEAICVYNERDVIADIQNTICHLGGAMHQVEAAVEGIVQGRGTVGKLIENDHLYLEINGVLSKVNNLMNDLNQYGLLFHLNKQWQRGRLQKVSQLNALDSPQHFQAYCQREVDEINASMGRISMLINRAERSPQSEQILESQQFRRDFADLLRKADSLSDNLRLYNQKFIDINEKNK